MSLGSFAVFVIACLIAVASASPLIINDAEDVTQAYYEYEEPMSLVRHVRSPGGGSVQIDYSQDRFGKAAGIQYNQNLFKSNDGRLTVDAYARGSRNFDYNRNDYGGGLQGSYHFG